MEKPADEIRIQQVTPVTHPALIEYMTKRGIWPGLTYKYYKEVEFTLNKKDYIALGFQNEREGFELRNRNFKGSSNPKDITIIEGRISGKPFFDCYGTNEKIKERVNVFEESTDFLSYLAMKEIEAPLYDCIILNSLSFYSRAVKLIQSAGYISATLYLENNNAGDKYTAKMIEELKKAGITTTDLRKGFDGFENLNGYWKAFLNANQLV